MWKDPIVEEVRIERMKIEQECGYSFDALSAQATKVQESVKDRLADRKSVRLPSLSK